MYSGNPAVSKRLNQLLEEVSSLASAVPGPHVSAQICPMDHQLLVGPLQTITTTVVSSCFLTDLMFEGEPSGCVPDLERT